MTLLDIDAHAANRARSARYLSRVNVSANSGMTTFSATYNGVT